MRINGWRACPLGTVNSPVGLQMIANLTPISMHNMNMWQVCAACVYFFVEKKFTSLPHVSSLRIETKEM